ncbi:MAG: glutamyl-tRNA reductase [Candidatus Eremiobacteraeota bacterium]|nr:glutamyl-tRNA reductase [Candidatus Eremiobacteraeota bacterium]
MPIVCLGLSHRTAPLEVREHHAFPASRVVEALVALRDYEAVKEAIMLQTCGRLEIYAELDDYEGGVAQLKTFLTNFGHGIARDRYDLDSYLYTLLGRQAIEHVFRVATGLDSMLVGEAEILGQVKDAYIQAQSAKSLGKTLHRLFREALNAGKHARTQTRIGDESASIATAAIEAAKARLGSIDETSILVIGAGKMGRTAVRRLRAEGARRLIVANRSMSRAQDLIAEVGFGEAIELPGLIDALAAADIAVTSTGASHFILDPAHVALAMAQRPERPLFIIDIAVPRDVDPAVNAMTNVTLVDIDGLKSVVDEKLEVRREAIPQVEEIIEEFVTRFESWYRSRLAVPIIASLAQKADAIRVTELERLFSRCTELSEREKMLVTGMSLTLVSKLLHSAIVKIREKAITNHAEAVSHARVLDDLFDLNLAEAMKDVLPQRSFADLDE